MLVSYGTFCVFQWDTNYTKQTFFLYKLITLRTFLISTNFIYNFVSKLLKYAVDAAKKDPFFTCSYWTDDVTLIIPSRNL